MSNITQNFFDMTENFPREYITKQQAIDDFKYSLREFTKALYVTPSGNVRKNEYAGWVNDGHYKSCTNCKMCVSKRTLGSSLWKFCPNCGAVIMK